MIVGVSFCERPGVLLDSVYILCYLFPLCEDPCTALCTDLSMTRYASQDVSLLFDLVLVLFTKSISIDSLVDMDNHQSLCILCLHVQLKLSTSVSFFKAEFDGSLGSLKSLVGDWQQLT